VIVIHVEGTVQNFYVAYRTPAFLGSDHRVELCDSQTETAFQVVLTTLF